MSPWRWWPSWLKWRGQNLGGARPVRSLGERGEDQAAKYLRRRKHRIVARRHRTRYGELDLITMDGNTIVFVEVKTRSVGACDESPAEAVDIVKQRQLTRAALAFLRSRGLLGQRCRFDVVAIAWPAHSPRPAAIRHFVSAFESTDQTSLY